MISEWSNLGMVMWATSEARLINSECRVELCTNCQSHWDYHTRQGRCLFNPGTAYTNPMYTFDDLPVLYWARYYMPRRVMDKAEEFHPAHSQDWRELWAAKQLWQQQSSPG